MTRPPRRRLQFTLMSLLGFVLVCAATFAFLRVAVGRGRQGGMNIPGAGGDCIGYWYEWESTGLLLTQETDTVIWWLSELPLESYGRNGEEFVLKPQGLAAKTVDLTSNSTVIVLKQDGTLAAGPSPVSRAEVEQLIADALANYRIAPRQRPIVLGKEFIRGRTDRSWPERILQGLEDL